VSLRQRLLLLFSLTVAAAVAAVAWTVLIRIRHVFEQRDQEETALFVSQFQREFQNRSADIAAAVDRLTATEQVRVMASAIVQSGDSAPYLTESQSLAQQAQLDFLEIVGPDGNVVSSAQWPARFGYPEPAANHAGQAAFLKREDLPDGTSALGLFAVRAIPGSPPSVVLIGGRRIDRQFLADLPDAPGMQIALYSVPSAAAAHNDDAGSFDSKQLIATAGDLPNPGSYRPLIESALKTGQQQTQILYLTGNRNDSLSATAIPLKDTSDKVLAVLLVALSRAGMVEAQQHIRAIAYGVASVGILLAIALSLWIAARVRSKNWLAPPKRWPRATGMHGRPNMVTTRSQSLPAASIT
jgi:two-component system, NtrC family, nitrogen regulation sensor histidine kinase NtrY